MPINCIPSALWLLLLMLADEMTPVTSLHHMPVVVNYRRSRKTQSGPVLCPLEEADKTIVASTLHNCSVTCARESACKCFSTKNSYATCDLYNFKLRLTLPTVGCETFEKIVEDEVDCFQFGPVPSSNVTIDDDATSIPSQCCSMPYSVNRAMHFNCSVNSAVSSDFGCFNKNGQWATCLQPEEFTAQYEETSTTALSADPAVSVPLQTANGWIVMQRKVTGGLVSFNQNWAAYRDGFGSASGNDNYWLGLEKLYRLMQLSSVKLRVEILRLNGKWKVAEYSTFSISDEVGNYRLTVDGYSGDAGDALTDPYYPGWVLNGQEFSTPDRDNDDNPAACATVNGWWFNKCSTGVLNYDGDEAGIWTENNNDVYNVRASRMLVKLVY